MPDFSRVLCAIDLTDPSRRALDCALWWARQHGADVSVLNVRALAPPPGDANGLAGDVISPAATPPALVDPPLTPAERDARLLELETFVHGRRTDGLQVEVLLDEDASLSGAILARADALAADLIVMGAGTNPDSEHPTLGAATAEVLRSAPCSVLVVPSAPDAANPCVAGMKRVMCAVSLSEASVYPLECATSLAGQGATHLTVVHVVELFSEVAALAYDFDAHREARLQPACDELVELVAIVVRGQRPVEEIVAQGTASREILKLALEDDTDLIVVGRVSAARLRTGGHHTGQDVAREARCPVLFVHAEAPVLALDREPVLGEDATAGAASGA